MTVRIVYLVHDTADKSVHRRVRMLTLGGASVHLAGFRRGTGAQPVVADAVATVDLGVTADARLLSRVGSVAKTIVDIRLLKETVRDADVIVARNLEMLAIASRARALFAPKAALVYECLDIHRMLLSSGVPGRILRTIESRLWRNADLILTSSPAFMQRYFEPRRYKGGIHLVENKLLLPGNEPARAAIPRPQGPPWKIGLFGMLRCRKSLHILAELAAALNGKVEIVLRGRASPAVFPDLNAELAALPHVSYLGPYDGSDDLARIYNDVHFAWAIDFYEEGQNSSWLLPNRIYESSYFGAVPIALADVETGYWLKRHKAGVVMANPLALAMKAFFSTLDETAYAKHAAHVAAIPDESLSHNLDDCQHLVQQLIQPRGFVLPAAANAVGSNHAAI